VNVYKMKA